MNIADVQVKEVPMRGLLVGDYIYQYLTAGRGTFTIVSKRTRERFTYKLNRAPDDPQKPKPEEERPIWVKVLRGQDNETDYDYLGVLKQWPMQTDQLEYRPGFKSKIHPDAPSSKAFMWFIKTYNDDPHRLVQQAEVWHEGRCGRCGRKLTVPTSIQRGFGPECIGRMS